MYMKEEAKNVIKSYWIGHKPLLGIVVNKLGSAPFVEVNHKNYKKSMGIYLSAYSWPVVCQLRNKKKVKPIL